MFYMILGGIWGFLLGVEKKLGMIVDYTLFGILCGLGLYGIVGIPLGFYLPRTEGITTEQEICAFSDSSSTESYNFLFSGYIQDELVYRYVIETERGKHIEEVKYNVYIHEGNYKPTVKFHKYGGFKEDWYKLFALDFSAGDTEYVEFYVPENTITNEYQIDLQ